MTETKSKNLEQIISRLQDSLGWMDQVFSNMSDGILIIGDNMKARFVNDALAEMTGRSRIRLLGMPVWEILELSRNGDTLSKNNYRKMAERNKLETLSGRYTLHGEKQLTINLSVSAIPKMGQVIFFIHNVTEQQRKDEALVKERLNHIQEKVRRQKTEENQRLLQSIIDGTSAIIYLKDLNGRYIMVNNRYEEAFELEETELKGKSDSDIFSEEMADIFLRNDEKVLNRKEQIRWEENIPHKGKLNTYLHLKFPLLDSTGTPHSLCGVLTDITARKELEKRKEDFIRMASHELKTPLTSIKLLLDFTKREIEQGELKSSLQAISKFENQLDKLSTLVEDLLNVSRLETGKLKFKLTEFSLNALVRETIELVQPTTEDHTIRFRKMAEDPSVVADRQRIEQVLINLLTNAIKYSPEGGNIIVKTVTGPDRLTVSVQDFGIGISPEHQKHIFDRFYKSTMAEGKFPGLGIGLYIASEIVDRHGGTMYVESEEGEGSTFFFRLPRK